MFPATPHGSKHRRPRKVFLLKRGFTRGLWCKPFCEFTFDADDQAALKFEDHIQVGRISRQARWILPFKPDIYRFGLQTKDFHEWLAIGTDPRIEKFTARADDE